MWDKGAHIDFLAPGRSAVKAVFTVNDAILERIREHTAGGAKYLPDFVVEVTDTSGRLVARVHRTLYVRAKPHRRPPSQPLS